jgi:hypothetical protein
MYPTFFHSQWVRRRQDGARRQITYLSNNRDGSCETTKPSHKLLGQAVLEDHDEHTSPDARDAQEVFLGMKDCSHETCIDFRQEPLVVVIIS